MMAMTITSLLLALAFLAFAAWRLGGLPESISGMVWALPRGGWRWLWAVWLWAVAITAFAPMVELMDAHSLGILGFLPMVLLGFVGAMPLFLAEQRRAHNVLGVAAGVASQIGPALLCVEWLWLWWIIPVLWLASDLWPWLGRRLDGREVLVAECICALTVWGSVLTTYNVNL